MYLYVLNVYRYYLSRFCFWILELLPWCGIIF